MSDDKDPKKTLSDLQAMVGSDLMKARHYMKQGIKIAIIAGDTPKSEELAKFWVELNDLVERYESSYRKIVD